MKPMLRERLLLAGSKKKGISSGKAKFEDWLSIRIL
jgi:hypothetical protein